MSAPREIFYPLSLLMFKALHYILLPINFVASCVIIAIVWIYRWTLEE